MTHKATMLACEFGITTQAIVNNLTPILFVIFKDNFGISYTLIANLALINFLIQLSTDALSVKIINALGYRKTGILAQFSALFGLIALGTLPRLIPVYPGLLISTILYAFGGGLLEVMVSPIVDSLDLGHSSARMSMLHSFYCWGQLVVVLVTTFAIKIFSHEIWWIIAICWAIIPLINSILFMIVPIPAIAGDEEKKSPKSLFKIKMFVVMCILMTCSGASEITMSQWASLFAQKGLGINKFVGDLLGPCLFAVFMGIGRLSFGIFGGRLNLHKSLTIASLLCTLCYLTTALSQNPFIALFACAFTGFATSIMWPGVYSFSSRMLVRGGTVMFSILALFGDIGCSLGSWLCGTVSDFAISFNAVTSYADKLGITYDQIGLKIGLATTAIFPIIMFLALISIKNKSFK